LLPDCSQPCFFVFFLFINNSHLLRYALDLLGFSIFCRVDGLTVLLAYTSNGSRTQLMVPLGVTKSAGYDKIYSGAFPRGRFHHSVLPSATDTQVILLGDPFEYTTEKLSKKPCTDRFGRPWPPRIGHSRTDLYASHCLAGSALSAFAI